jgi:hypothetical protein
MSLSQRIRRSEVATDCRTLTMMPLIEAVLEPWQPSKIKEHIENKHLKKMNALGEKVFSSGLTSS